MKILIISVAFIMVTFSVFSQKKGKVDPRDAKIDSLTKSNAILTKQSDSLSKELVKYFGVYTAMRDKVLRYNFDPTRTAYIIDSIKASRDSSIAALSKLTNTQSLSDSIYKLLIENKMLKAQIDTLKAGWGNEKNSIPREIEKASAISNLKQLKELLDAKIITEAEFIALKQKYMIKL
jgi:hypothetical protein